MNEIERYRTVARYVAARYNPEHAKWFWCELEVDAVKRNTKLSKRERNARITEIVELYNE